MDKALRLKASITKTHSMANKINHQQAKLFLMQLSNFVFASYSLFFRLGQKLKIFLALT